MFKKPEQSPWGKTLECEMICPGVFIVETADFGAGTMVVTDMAVSLSPAAQKCGFEYGGYLCFASDVQEHVIHRELLDKKLWDFRNSNYVEDYEEIINDSLQKFNPEYWQARQSGFGKEPEKHNAALPPKEKGTKTRGDRE